MHFVNNKGTLIKSFRDKETEKVFQREFSRKLPRSILQRADKKLAILDAAATLEDLARIPGNRLEKLGGKRVGQYSIRINEQWRICFLWKEGDAHEVEIIDYHS